MNELSKLLNVSDTTIYRDLINLKDTRFVSKVHGGAVWVEESVENNNKVEHRINVRLRREVEEKQEIAKKAVQFIGDETSIFLDHSSTCIYLAKELAIQKYQHLVVVTNSIKILDELEGNFTIHAISTGGALEHQWSALTGPYALDFISKLNLEQVFISCGAVSIEKGVMTSFPFVAEILKKAREVTRKVNLVVDSSKFTRVGAFSVMPLADVDRIITDKRLDQELAEKCRDLGIDMIV